MKRTEAKKRTCLNKFSSLLSLSVQFTSVCIGLRLGGRRWSRVNFRYGGMKGSALSNYRPKCSTEFWRVVIELHAASASVAMPIWGGAMARLPTSPDPPLTANGDWWIHRSLRTTQTTAQICGTYKLEEAWRELSTFPRWVFKKIW